MTRFTHALGIHTAMIPAARKPTTSHGDIAANTSANEIKRLHIVFIVAYYTISPRHRERER